MTHRPARLDLRHLRATLYADGIYGLPGAFAPEWVSRLHQECLELHEAASAYKTGRISRGRNRWYFAVHPEQLSGVVDLLTHPYLTSISEALLGANYQVAEVAFDVSFPGSKFQPWHRDFRKHVGMRDDGSLCALAFNVPTVSVTDEMGPFEIVLGTQNDEVAVDNGMFPDPDAQAHYERDPRRKKIKPQRGGMSVRTPLAIHRGTPNVSEHTRPVMVATVYAGDVDLLQGHDVLSATREFHDALPAQAREHLHCRVVEKLQRIDQGHDIEGLVMGEE
ncbi:MAG: phytanoyl-CoA dioxygenase family protein [Actinomycetota bacterium]|nr:phytanoyl-CoA dioxygenase family protein [Actinomycetota bacterium]